MKQKSGSGKAVGRTGVERHPVAIVTGGSSGMSPSFHASERKRPCRVFPDDRTKTTEGRRRQSPSVRGNRWGLCLCRGRHMKGKAVVKMIASMAVYAVWLNIGHRAATMG